MALPPRVSFTLSDVAAIPFACVARRSRTAPLGIASKRGQWRADARFYCLVPPPRDRVPALSASPEEIGPWPGAEGATAPETLRQKDCRGRALWKAGAALFALWRSHRRGKPARCAR